MKFSVLTPTCDRPIGITLLEAMMRRQTIQPDQWIVADGGEVPAVLTMGQIHLRDPKPAGALNFASNLLNGIDACTSELMVLAEDDDWLAPTHLESMKALGEKGHKLIGTEEVQRYYNVAHRCWRMFNNIGASLCQTAIHRDLFPTFRRVIHDCIGKGTYGIDTNFWKAVSRNDWAFTRRMTVVGIKGLPGRAGLGVGHRPDARWSRDPTLDKLRGWIGPADAATYAPFEMAA
jgi:hypothetical protein